jgi:hypothetical protein
MMPDRLGWVGMCGRRSLPMMGTVVPLAGRVIRVVFEVEVHRMAPPGSMAAVQ